MNVYVSGPMSSDYERGQAAAVEAGDALIELGHAPYLPQFNFGWHQRSPKPWAVWVEIDLRLLGAFDAILVLDDFEGMPKSVGREVEHQVAKQLGLIVWTSLGDVPMASPGEIRAAAETREKIQRMRRAILGDSARD